MDRAAIDARAQGGDRKARTVRRSLQELSFQLSGAQLGITIAALLTGYLAEPALAHLIEPLIGDRPGLVHLIALVIATLFSMLFGELIPKNAALARPMPLVLATAAPQRVFSMIFSWLIRLLNGSANALVRRLGIEPQEELASARSPEELSLLAALSAQAGALPEDTALLLQRTIRFGDKRAAEAMTPRIDVISLEAITMVAAMLETARVSGHSRFPVYESEVDQITGVVTVIDALAVPPAERPHTPVGLIAREPVYVPESLDLDGVLRDLQAAGAELAIVVDEYGGTDGLVTIEDLAEELVGEISDEHDTELAAYEVIDARPAPEAGGSLLVEGVVREGELEELTGFRLPEGPYETLAGFLMARLGHIPVEGETVEEHGWRFTVTEIDRHRVEQVRVTSPERTDG